MKTITLLIIALYISPAYAKVYKCIVNEQTKYQQTPCSEHNSHGGEIELIPNTVSTKELRQYIKQDRLPKKRREKKEKKARKAKRAWMNREVNSYSKHRKKVSKKKSAERKKQNQEKINKPVPNLKIMRKNQYSKSIGL